MYNNGRLDVSDDADILEMKQYSDGPIAQLAEGSARLLLPLYMCITYDMIYVYMQTYTYMCIHIYIYTYVHTSHIYIYIYIYMYMYVCIYNHTFR